MFDLYKKNCVYLKTIELINGLKVQPYYGLVLQVIWPNAMSW